MPPLTLGRREVFFPAPAPLAVVILHRAWVADRLEDKLGPERAALCVCAGCVRGRAWTVIWGTGHGARSGMSGAAQLWRRCGARRENTRCIADRVPWPGPAGGACQKDTRAKVQGPPSNRWRAPRAHHAPLRHRHTHTHTHTYMHTLARRLTVGVPVFWKRRSCVVVHFMNTRQAPQAPVVTRQFHCERPNRVGSQ